MSLDIRCSTDKIKTASPTFTADKSSGDWLQLENFVGVVVNDVAYATQADNPLIYEADDIVAPKLAGTAWVAGDTLYFDTTALTFTPTYAAGLVKAGVALEDVASAGTSGRIHLRGDQSAHREQYFMFSLKEDAVAVSQSDAKLASFQAPFGFTISEVCVHCSAVVATASVDVKEATTSILSSAITPVADTNTLGTISDGVIADNAAVNIHVTTDGSGEITDLVVTLTCKRQ